MNILELQDTLKNFSQQQLVREMQMPSGQVPQYLILTELDRRKRMEADMQAQIAKGQPTVADEVVAAAGVPQEDIMQAAQSMAPESSIEQNTGVKQMAEGGVVKANEAGFMTNLMNTRGIMGARLGDKFPFNTLGYTSGEKFSDNPEAFKPVPPFPVGDPNPRARAVWNSRYKDTHNRDGSPKYMDPNVGMQGGIGSLSANAEDYQAPNIAMQTQSKRAAASPIDRPVSRTASGMPSVPSAEGFNTISAAPVFDATQDLGSGTNTGLENVVQRNDDLGNFGTGDSDVPRAGGPLAVGSLAQGLIDATGNIPSTMPPTFDTGTEGLGNLEDIIGDIVQTETEEESGELSEALSRRPGFRTSPGDTITGIFSGQTPNEKATAALESFIPRDDSPSGDLSQVETLRKANRTIGEVFPDVDFADPSMVPDPSQGVDPVTQEKVDRTPSVLDIVNDFLPNVPVADGFTGTGSSSDGVDAPIPMPNENQPTIDIDTTPTIDTSTPDQSISDAKLDELLGGGDDEVESRGVVIEDTDPREPKTTKGGGGSGGMSSIESEIAQLLKDREREADKDKWLALAKMGMALMSSKSPTLGGALGEAGIKGMEDLQKSRAAYKKDKLGLLGLKQRAEQARITNQRLADAANRKSDKSGLTGSNVVSLINSAEGDLSRVLNDIATIQNDVGAADPETLAAALGPLKQRAAALQVQISEYRKLLGGGGSGTNTFNATN